MALQTVNLDSPLTDAQAELTAKLGAIKNLLSIPKIKFPKLGKDKQISLFDYIIKVLEILGIDAKALIESFIYQFFDEDKLTKNVLSIFANMAADNGKNLQYPAQSSSNPNPSQKKQLSRDNLTYLYNSQVGSALKTFLRAQKILLAKKVIFLIFGGDGNGLIEDINYTGNPPFSYQENPDDLKKEASCGTELFSLTNLDSITEISQSDLEYNRIKVLQNVQNGNVEYTISCQGVQISLPTDPLYFFQEGGPNQLIAGAPIENPGRSISLLFNYVGDQVQKQNKETNANAAATAFAKNFVEKLIQYAPIILRPVFEYVFQLLPSIGINIPTNPSNSSNDLGFSQADFTSTACDILNNPQNQKKKDSSYNLCNILLKMLLNILITYLIKEITKLATLYITTKVVEKMKRKNRKIAERFAMMEKIRNKVINKITKLNALLTKIQPILDLGVPKV